MTPLEPIRWHLPPDLAAVWPSGADPLAAWTAAGVAEIVKRGPQRTVYGVLHRDLHAGNFLVRRETEEVFLVDLDAVRLGSPLDEAASVANLAMLAAGFVRRASRTDRFRFLSTYVRARGWTEDRLHSLVR